jgi:hypothetical protein
MTPITRAQIDYYIAVESELTENIVNFAYRNVFRTDFQQSGFVVLDFGVSMTSEALRKTMVDLKNALHQKVRSNLGMELHYLWMGRFDQQETTKFHRDHAGHQSFLMLGYEPTSIKSKLFLADYAQFSKSIHISEEEYFAQYNPMYIDGENFLMPYVTEVQGFDEKNFKIVLINNSCMSDKEGTIGVLHKAEMIEHDPRKQRIINSTMLNLTSPTDTEAFTLQQQIDFISTPKISKPEAEY